MTHLRSGATAGVIRFSGALRRFLGNRKAATAVEFAIVALPFFALLCATIEVAFVDFESEMLQDATTQAARAMLTGQLQGANVSTAAQFVSNYMCPSTGRVLPSNLDCSRLIVDVRTASSFQAADLANDFYKSSSNEFCPGMPGQVVVMRVAYPLGQIVPLNLFTPGVGVVNDVPGLSGSYHILEGASLFVEEDYAGSYTQPTGC